MDISKYLLSAHLQVSNQGRQILKMKAHNLKASTEVTFSAFCNLLILFKKKIIFKDTPYFPPHLLSFFKFKQTHFFFFLAAYIFLFLFWIEKSILIQQTQIYYRFSMHENRWMNWKLYIILNPKKSLIARAKLVWWS